MSSVKVLVVDDASFVRDMVKRTLRSNFPMVKYEEAINGKKAQALMNRVNFDLILCDWEMPEMSGMDLLKWARQQENYKKTPFILVTSRGDKSHVLEAVQEGASDYLGKPFSAEQISAKIIKAIGKKLRAAGGGGGNTTTPLQDASKNTANLLTSASVKAASKPPQSIQSANLLTGGAASAQDQKSGEAKTVEPKSQNFAEVRFAGVTLKCVIKAISLTEVRVIAKRDATFPGILDAAVVDMEFEPGSVARLNGYVHQLQAVEKRQDADFVSIVIRFVDEDPEKMEHLSKFMEKFR